MIIYKTTNLINGKIYIGQYRGKSKKYFGSGTLIKQAIKKYGKENFVRETLEDNIDNQTLLNEREKYWISFYKSRDRDIGYNLTEGGDGNPSPDEETRKKMADSHKGEKHYLFNKHQPEETRRKIAEGNRGKKASLETLKKMSAVASGENNPFYGKHHTEESKLKNSESNKIAQAGENNGMFGKKQKEESKKKMSLKWEENKEERIKLKQGKKPNKKTSSKYVGVVWYKNKGKWTSNIGFKKQRYFLGYFDTEEEAAEAYNKKVLEFYGENAKLNIIRGKDKDDN